MSRSYQFEGKTIKQPGVYSAIKSGIKNPKDDLTYGGVTIIDTGAGAGFGGGAGIAGTIKKGADSIGVVYDVSSMREHVKGGLFYLLAEALFLPSKKLGVKGASYVEYVRACATAPAQIDLVFTGGGANGGVFEIQCKDEGLVGNGAAVNGILTRGFAARLTVGRVNTSQFMVSFYQGTFKGLDASGQPFDFIPEALSQPRLLVQSPEFSNVQTLIDWMNSSAQFKQHFVLKTVTKNGTGSVTTADLTANPGNIMAVGGTETYSAAHLETALNAVKASRASFILLDKYGDSAKDTLNLSIVNFNKNEMKFPKQVYVGGGHNDTKWTGTNGSIDIAQFYNNQDVTVVHGGCHIDKPKAGGLKEYPSIYKAALCLGREAGLLPQVPLTFKDIAIDGELHVLNDNEKDVAIDEGVLYTNYDYELEAFVVGKSINSLQANQFLVNEDSTTSSKQFRRIILQLNKELMIKAKKDLLGQEDGVNRFTLNEADVAAWTNGFLSSKTATGTTDNLIIRHQNVIVNRNGEAYYVSYEVILNTEINFIFFVGSVIE